MSQIHANTMVWYHANSIDGGILYSGIMPGLMMVPYHNVDDGTMIIILAMPYIVDSGIIPFEC